MRVFSRDAWGGWVRRVMARAGWWKMPGGAGWFGGGGLAGYSNLGSRRAQVQAYRNHVYKCVSVIYRRCLSVPWALYVERGSESEEVPRHPFIDLMRRPNPYMSGRLLKAMTIMHLDLCGVAFWLKVQNSLRRPAELWPLPAGNFVRLILNDAGTDLVGYEFVAGGGRPVAYAAEDVVYFRYPHPEYMLEGASPLQAMAFAYDTDLAHRTHQRNFFQNSARPDLVLQTEQEIQPEDATRLLLGWKERHQGVDRSWEPAILDKGLKPAVVSSTNKDIEFAALKGWTKEDILEAYGVPEGKLGSVKNVNRANALGIDITFNSECIVPRLDLFDETVSLALLPDYGKGLYIEHANPIPRDREFDLKERESNLKTKYTTVNEERAAAGLEPVPWGDRPWALISEIQVGDEPRVEDRGVEAGAETKRVAKADDDRRDRIRQAHERRVATRSRAFRTPLRTFFRSLRDQVLAGLEEQYDRVESAVSGMSRAKLRTWIEEHKDVMDRIGFDLQEADRELMGTSRPYWEGMLIASGEEAIRVLDMDVDFDLYDPRVSRFISERENLIKEVNRVTYESIQAELTAGFEAGEPMEAIARRVREVFDYADKTRSMRIAQTEMNTAANRGALEGYRQAGAQGKEWVAGPDARDTHMQAAARYQEGGDPGPIPLDADFEVGAGRGPAPGSIGLPEEDINCRCALVPVVRRD